jgi:hypothetical protein
MQTRLSSFKEAIANSAAGFVYAVLLNWACLKLLAGWSAEITAVVVTVVFTIASIIRSYAIRRAFNRKG